MPLEPQLIAFGEQAEVVGSLDVGAMWERVRGEFLDEWAQQSRQGLSGADLERAMQAHMDGLSEKPLTDLARKSSSVAYNQGRAAEITSQPAVEFVVRSEVLDSATCEECAALDSAVVEVDSPEFARLQPPAFCLGGRRCRGFYVPVAGEAFG